MLRKKHPHSGDDQENAEEIEDEVKTGDQCDAQTDHNPAHDERADDAPHQHPMLRHGRDTKVPEDQDKNENVIDAQRVFDQIAGQEIERRVRAAQFPNEKIEKQRKNDPDRATLRRCAHA